MNLIMEKNQTVQEILKSDKYFEKNYNDKLFVLEKAKINNISAIEFFSDYNEENDGSGFIFGNEKNEQIQTNRRNVDYCVSFDHKSKGFNSNES